MRSFPNVNHDLGRFPSQVKLFLPGVSHNRRAYETTYPEQAGDRQRDARRPGAKPARFLAMNWLTYIPGL